MDTYGRKAARKDNRSYICNTPLLNFCVVMSECVTSKVNSTANARSPVQAQAAIFSRFEFETLSNSFLDRIRSGPPHPESTVAPMMAGMNTPRRNLFFGYKGATRAIQRRMNIILTADQLKTIAEDGDWDAHSFQAVAMLLQRAAKLPITPNVDAATLRILDHFDSVEPNCKGKILNLSSDERQMIHSGQWSELRKKLLEQK